MKIVMHEIPVSEVYRGYQDSAQFGVVAYDGKLNVRPAFQREFVYKDKQRDEVIRTVMKDFPLNVFYWVKNNKVAHSVPAEDLEVIYEANSDIPVTLEDDSEEKILGRDAAYEMLDGQQRTISICSYINGDFSIDYKYFHNLTLPEQNQILNYKLMVYICDGTEKEKLDWFRIINIAGVQLTPQELRNAIYTGEWLTNAKKWFSKTQCPAYKIAEDYMTGVPIRQDYLETALEWITDRNGQDIEDYMAVHQHHANASELWVYFQEVIDWVKRTFPHYRREMKGLPWGIYYNRHTGMQYDPATLEKKVSRLMLDDDVTNKKGIYLYVLSGDEKHLNIRAFTNSMKRSIYDRQNGICLNCGGHFDIDDMQADHIDPWSKGGKTTIENGQMLCGPCNRRKSAI